MFLVRTSSVSTILRPNSTSPATSPHKRACGINNQLVPSVVADQVAIVAIKRVRTVSGVQKQLAPCDLDDGLISKNLARSKAIVLSYNH